MAAFVVGAVLGRSGLAEAARAVLTPTSASSGLLAIPLVIVPFLAIARGTRRQIFAALGVSVVGCGWGLVHAAPSPPRIQRDAVVLAASVGCAGSGPLLVATGSGVYEATGSRQTGAWGDLVPIGGSRLLSEARGHFVVTFASAPELGLLCRAVVDPLRAHMIRLARLNAGAAEGWYRGLVLGDAGGLPTAVTEDFKRLGVYHLLVVSGLHVTLMAWLLGAALRLPLQIAYAARLVDPGAWRRAARMMAVLGAVAAWCYLLATGATAASQRASFLYVVVVVTRLTCGAVPLGRRMVIAAVGQSLVYPIGFLSEGNLMSWTAYILVAQAAPDLRGSLRRQIAAAAWLQARLMVGAGAVFGQVAWLGLLANALFVPAFPLLLVSALAVLSTESPSLLRLCLGIHQGFVAIVRRVASLCDHFSWLYLASADVGPTARAAMVLASAVVVLIAVRGLSIRSQDPRAALKETSCRSIRGKVRKS